MRALLHRTRPARIGAVAVISLAGVTASGAVRGIADQGTDTATPIKHVVVIFQENVSFDHYFGAYPNAANTSGQPFSPAPGTPAVNGLTTALLTANPNQKVPPGVGSANPRRYNPAVVGDVLTCDQDHNYRDEQLAAHNGAMDVFPQSVGNGSNNSPVGTPCNANDVMNYYDGNTTTALWNYAQRFAMSDNSYNTTYGPSSPGAINLVSGNTGGVDIGHAVNPQFASLLFPNNDLVADGKGGYSLINDAQPYWDDCSTRESVAMSGKNVGDELNAAGLSWGWFEGGSKPTTTFQAALTATGHSGQSTATFIPDEFKNAGFQNGVPHSTNQGLCDAVHPVGVAVGGTGQYRYKDDYIPHHQPFMYYASTANPHHLTVATNPDGTDSIAGLQTIGADTQHYMNGLPQFDTPNHQYDMSDFDQLVSAINNGDLPASALPAVSFLKAPGYQDGHAFYSDPLDEQQFVTREINALMRTPDWRSTAVIINYDDSDGWYDHQFGGITNPSQTVSDALTAPGQCGTGTNQLAGEQGRCGPGPRIPLLVISPWAKQNAVDDTHTDQSSILRFVEDNWQLPKIDGSFDQRAGTLTGLFDFSRPNGEPPNAERFVLDPSTGQPTHG
jgi:phospholipase C